EAGGGAEPGVREAALCEQSRVESGGGGGRGPRARGGERSHCCSSPVLRYCPARPRADHPPRPRADSGRPPGAEEPRRAQVARRTRQRSSQPGSNYRGQGREARGGGEGEDVDGDGDGDVAETGVAGFSGPPGTSAPPHDEVGGGSSETRRAPPSLTTGCQGTPIHRCPV